jgi:hypothetical protein
MIEDKIEKRLYLIGGKPQLVVFGDISEVFEMIEILHVPHDKIAPEPGAMQIFILGGRLAEKAPVEIPKNAKIIFSNRYVLIRSDNNHRYGEWYGKAQTIIDIRSRRAVISIPGLEYFNRDFISRQIFRPVLDRLLFEYGYISLHAAGVSKAKNGCVIAGIGGQGKSTLLSSLIDADMSFLADDRVLIKHENKSSPVIHSFPEYIRLPIDESGPKNRVVPPESKVHTAFPKVILLLDREGEGMKDSFEPIGSAEAAARLLQFTPPFMEEHMYKKAANVVFDMCRESKNFLIKGWGDPHRRLQCVLQILKEM